MLLIHLLMLIPYVTANGVVLETLVDQEELMSQNISKLEIQHNITDDMGYLHGEDVDDEDIDEKYFDSKTSHGEFHWQDLMQDISVAEKYVSRCSRRYNPGICLEPNRVVWTFAFQSQNCTERLGCPQSMQGNRFPNYAFCMRRCQALVDIYTHIMSHENNSICKNRSKVNVTDSTASRRLMDEEAFQKLEDQLYDEEDMENVEPDLSVLMPDYDEEPSELDGILGTDIDRYALRFRKVSRNQTDDFLDVFKTDKSV